MKLREPKCDSDRDRLAQRMAKLKEKLFSVMERNAELEEENAGLRAEIGDLKQQLAAARKDSSTSSKPPSSDIVKPKKPLPKGGAKRKKGGQPGHDRHLRSPFPTEAVDHFEPHTLDCCPDCGGMFERLPGEAVLNIDETGHKENGQKSWAWCFRSQMYTFFRIDKSRGSKVLVDVLGEEFNGVLGCDDFSAYRKYMRECDVLVRFCMAHLIREVNFLLTLPGHERAYGQRLRDVLRNLFGVIHRREKMTAAGFQKSLEAAREQVMKAATSRVPDANHARNPAKRFRENGEAYFRLITTRGIDPTNNLAKQAIRFVVIDRHITQGTRSEKGRRWCERIWTVIATCARQRRAVFQFLLDSVHSHFCGTHPPSLLPSSPWRHPVFTCIVVFCGRPTYPRESSRLSPVAKEHFPII